MHNRFRMAEQLHYLTLHFIKVVQIVYRSGIIKIHGGSYDMRKEI